MCDAKQPPPTQLALASTVSCGTFKFITTIPYEAYVYFGDFRAAVVKYHQSNLCNNLNYTTTVDDIYFFHSDRSGIPVKVYRASNSAAVWSADYDPFGSPFWIKEDLDGDGVKMSFPFRFPGQTALSQPEGGAPYTATTGGSGLNENGRRIYDSQIGRYLEPDPIFSVL